jgi:hypothetical protein
MSTATATNLFGNRATGAADTARLFALLEAAGHGWKIRYRGPRSAVLILGFDQDYRWVSFCDNGGEINVETVNRPATMQSIGTADRDPATGRRATVDTIFLRLAGALLEHPIDYTDHTPPGELDCILHRHGIEAAGRRLEQAATAYAVPAPPGESQESYSARAAGYVGDPRPLETRREFPDE